MRVILALKHPRAVTVNSTPGGRIAARYSRSAVVRTLLDGIRPSVAERLLSVYIPRCLFYILPFRDRSASTVAEARRFDQPFDAWDLTFLPILHSQPRRGSKTSALASKALEARGACEGAGMLMRKSLGIVATLAGAFGAAIITCSTATGTVHAAEQVKPEISEEASAALLRMGQTLSAQQFAFRANTIRAYSDAGGESLHIFHTMKVTVRRPNRLLADLTGDDGSDKLVFDGKTLTIYSAQEKKYASTSVPEGTTIDGMLKEAVSRYGVDFPLADFLSEAPNKAFLTGVTSGRVVNTVTIDGAPYDHLFFFQPPGIELELWLSKNEQSLPRRLIVTYRSLPGQPNFIAQFSDWNFNIHPADADFAFQPPAGATQMELKPVAATATPAAKKKGSR